MTATDELRRLLDDRGVEWEDFDGEPTWTDGDGRMHYARQELFHGHTDVVTVYNLTPEQAIAATLGSGKLTAEQVRNAIFNSSSYASYDGAKYYADGIRMQATADELNAMLGNGECELETIPALVVTMNMLNEIGWCKCSECGHATPDGSNYCQNCGRKVVE